ncbi:hypothetical protein Thpro_021795 [Acidihalobacter prosperus]|uniref:Uncharacterized protein n=1 Tax=Acidihalobacter prosperus TaxID=160660 RepID=A0A1A6C4H1_9GAMM|nr:hypothetical protein Thpro_021795 [Acidihalobacter prosperus]
MVSHALSASRAVSGKRRRAAMPRPRPSVGCAAMPRLLRPATSAAGRSFQEWGE